MDRLHLGSDPTLVLGFVLGPLRVAAGITLAAVDLELLATVCINRDFHSDDSADSDKIKKERKQISNTNFSEIKQIPGISFFQ